MTPRHDSRVDFLDVVYEPYGRSSEDGRAVRHAGREYLRVLEGELEAVIGFETLHLREGDSLAFDPQTPHQYRNPADRMARALSVVVHDPPDVGVVRSSIHRSSRPKTGSPLTEKKRIAVVIGSTRPTRICGGIAAWARDSLQEDSELNYSLIDLAEIALPFLDEPVKAALQQYEHEHTQAWSRLVQSYRGFLFVFPQYNWGYPGVLKNALDYLYREWRDRPASLLTYGTRGGYKAAEQFIGVLHGLHMRVLDTHVEAVITDQDLDDDWQLRDIDGTLRPNHALLRQIDEEMTAALADSP